MPLNTTAELLLEPEDSRRLARLCGQFDANLRQIEQRVGVRLANRGHHFTVTGDESRVHATTQLLHALYADTTGGELSPEQLNLWLQQAGIDQLAGDEAGEPAIEPIRTKKELIKPRGGNQTRYVRDIRSHDINFGIGPAGTGKTYLAVACAVESLLRDRVERILLVRPAVEAGEKLGFLPGDLSQKVDPYLRPLYDALYEMIGFETVAKLIQRNVIEVAPLAFMRGRTLNHSFIILDESQNTTVEQMKMFLTRLGFGSTAVVTGDVTQVDLPRGQMSGLIHCQRVLQDVPGISVTRFSSRDVVRHPLIQRIVEAYDAFDEDQPAR